MTENKWIDDVIRCTVGGIPAPSTHIARQVMEVEDRKNIVVEYI